MFLFVNMYMSAVNHLTELVENNSILVLYSHPPTLQARMGPIFWLPMVFPTQRAAYERRIVQ